MWMETIHRKEIPPQTQESHFCRLYEEGQAVKLTVIYVILDDKRIVEKSSHPTIVTHPTIVV